MDVPSTITVKGTEMIYIPSGEFLTGSDETTDEKPPHEVYLDGFYIARYPVTNGQYRGFVAATEHRSPLHWKGKQVQARAGGPFHWKAGTYPEDKGDHPVVCVSWHDALAYCSWLREEVGQEIRLPTEAEWEKAARGTDGRANPWGDEFDRSKCNTKQLVRYHAAPVGIGDTTPVGKYSPEGDSPYGVADMEGNVWEWCSSLKMDYPYNPDDGREDLEAVGSRILRGGSFSNIGPVRCAYRERGDPDNSSLNYFGFRVVVSRGFLE